MTSDTATPPTDKCAAWQPYIGMSRRTACGALNCHTSSNSSPEITCLKGHIMALQCAHSCWPEGRRRLKRLHFALAGVGICEGADSSAAPRAAGRLSEHRMRTH
jgi:hypothetical protein